MTHRASIDLISKSNLCSLWQDILRKKVEHRLA